jgi:Spy/CpxP family protein refolding chaperone
MILKHRLAAATSLVVTLSVGSIAAAQGQQTQTPPGQQPAPQQNQQNQQDNNDPADTAHGDLVHAAMNLGSLTSTQRSQIEALINQETAAHANLNTAHAQLLTALADAVSAGNVDAAALAPKEQMVVSAVIADDPADRAALEKLHAILTPAQRAELVNDAESRMQAHDQKMGAGHGFMTKELNLTAAQQNQIDANLRTMKESTDDATRTQERARHQAVLEAFKSNTFVMSQVAPAKNPQTVQKWVDHIVVMAQAETPVLTPEQRATVAAKLREWASNAQAR